MTVTLGTAGGQALSIGASVANRIGPVGTTRIVGNFEAYEASPYQTFTGMFGVDFASPNTATATSDQFVNETTFPSGVTFDWNVTPGGSYGGANGYLTLSYGNYDGSVGGITPKQVKNITTLTVNSTWTYTGNNSSDVLCECWLTTTSHATGGVTSADPVYEVGYVPHNSPGSQTFAQDATAVGSFTDTNSVTWNVVQAVSGVNSIPFFVANRVGYADHHGALDWKSYFTYLTTAGKITGNEYFNGLAYGVETFSGAGTLAISSFSATYS